MDGVTLNLEELGLRAGQSSERAYPIVLTPVSLGGVEYQVLLPEGALLAAERVAGGFILRLAAHAKVFGPCSRCLAEVAVDITAEQEEFAPTAAGGWAESQSSPFVEGVVVDVSGLAREALVLAMPERVLCSMSCKGLCPHCGVDLNREECLCARP